MRAVALILAWTLLSLVALPALAADEADPPPPRDVVETQTVTPSLAGLTGWQQDYVLGSEFERRRLRTFARVRMAQGVLLALSGGSVFATGTVLGVTAAADGIGGCEVFCVMGWSIAGAGAGGLIGGAILAARAGRNLRFARGHRVEATLHSLRASPVMGAGGAGVQLSGRF